MKFIALLLLLIVAFIQTSQSVPVWINSSTCTGMGGTLNGNLCYRITSPGSWSASRTTCLANGGDLGSIYSLAEQDYVATLNNNVWIGLNDIATENGFRNIDLPEVLISTGATAQNGGYVTWGSSEPNQSGEEDCVHTSGGTWNDLECGGSLPAVCKYYVGQITGATCTSRSGIIAADGFCYYPTSTAATWYNVLVQCRASGADLATITSVTANNAARQLVANTGNSMWIGISDLRTDGTFYTTDNPDTVAFTASPRTSFTYTNFGASEPNGGTTENCVAVGSNFLWFDIACSTNYRGVCKTPVLDSTPPVIANCPASISTAVATATSTAVVTWPTITATDNQGLANSGNPTSVTSSPTPSLNSGSAFPTGTTSMNVVFSDVSGNTAPCSFNVFVRDCSNSSFPPTLFANQSGIISGNLNLVFYSSVAYTASTFEFVGAANTACNSPTPTYWTSSYVSGCSNSFTANMPINYAFANCNFIRDESVADPTTYAATIRITSVQPGRTIRGVPLNTTTQTSVTVTIRFATAISASSGALTVYGPRITFSSITSQTFSVPNYVATLTLLTSVQSPYQLFNPILTSVSGFTLTSVPITAESGRPLVAVCQSGVTSPCSQLWSITIQRTASCSGGAATNLNYNGWVANFNVSCHASFTGSCSTPAPLNDAVSFDTASDDYCPRLIDTESATASLSVFSDSALTVPQNIFVFGARSYFRAVVNSPIALSALRVERITLLGSTPSGVSVLYFSTFSNAAAYFGGAPAVTYNNQPAGFTGTFAAFPSNMLLTENINGASSLQRIANFSWIWSGATSSANADAPVEMAVRVELRVRFANQSVVSDDHLITLTSKLPHSRNRLMEDAPSVSSTIQFQVQAASNDNDNNPISNGDSASSSGSAESVPVLSIGIAAVGCAIAVFAMIMVAVMVRNMREDKKYKNKQSNQQHAAAAAANTTSIVETSPSSVELIQH